MIMQQPFERAVADHGATVLRVCRAVLGPHADADDAWSETFLSAMRAWPELAPDANVEAWLVRIAHRKALDVIRRRSRHAVPQAEVVELSVSDAGSAERLELWSAVAALPDKQRMTIAYRYLLAMPYDEIAAITGGTAAAARRAAADGLRSLRKHPAFRAEGADHE